jgi:hypothetical protein
MLVHAIHYIGMSAKMHSVLNSLVSKANLLQIVRNIFDIAVGQKWAVETGKVL